MSTTKAWVAAIGSVVTAVTAALSDDVFKIGDAAQVASTCVMVLGTLYATYKIPNTPRV